MRRRNLLAGTGAIGALSAAAAVPAIAVPAGPDAALLALGKRLEAAWKAEDAAWHATGDLPESHPLSVRAHQLNRATGGIVDQIGALPATTHAGLLVKVRAVRWCRCNEAVTAADFEDGSSGELCTDLRLILSMMGDLYAMTGGAA